MIETVDDESYGVLPFDDNDLMLSALKIIQEKKIEIEKVFLSRPELSDAKRFLDFETIYSNESENTKKSLEWIVGFRKALYDLDKSLEELGEYAQDLIYKDND